MKHDKNKLNKIRKALEACAIKNITQLVETNDLVTKKPRYELRNYYKMFSKFLIELPDSMLDSELAILQTKVASGEFLKEIE